MHCTSNIEQIEKFRQIFLWIPNNSKFKIFKPNFVTRNIRNFNCLCFIQTKFVWSWNRSILSNIHRIVWKFKLRFICFTCGVQVDTCHKQETKNQLLFSTFARKDLLDRFFKCKLYIRSVKTKGFRLYYRCCPLYFLKYVYVLINQCPPYSEWECRRMTWSSAGKRCAILVPKVRDCGTKFAETYTRRGDVQI